MQPRFESIKRILRTGSPFRVMNCKDYIKEYITSYMSLKLTLEPITASDLSYVSGTNTLSEALVLISAIGQLRDSDTPDALNCYLEQVDCSFVDGEFLVEMKLTVANSDGIPVIRGYHPIVFDVTLDVGRGVENDYETPLVLVW